MIKKNCSIKFLILNFNKIYTYLLNYSLLVNIRFMCHVYKAHDLRETRIYTINTALEKNQLSIN